MPETTLSHHRAVRFSQAALFLSGALLTVISLFFGCSQDLDGLDPGSEPPQSYLPAMAEHDIAPWDGPAFGLWIPAEQFGGSPDSWISLRIWNSPEKSEKTFVFPDESMRLGAVKYFLNLKSPPSIDWKSQPRQELKGRVRFITANRRQPVIGEFDFMSEEATILRGRFQAQWINEGLPGKTD